MAHYNSLAVAVIGTKAMLAVWALFHFVILVAVEVQLPLLMSSIVNITNYTVHLDTKKCS